MVLSDYVNTFGQAMYARYAQRVHKICLNAAFTCPNRDGTKGRGGCTFCNNVSFNPNGRQIDEVPLQINNGRQVVLKRTGAERYIAYFQAYTNTYAELETLKKLYDQALAEPDVIGLSVGTRPDCVPAPVLDLLAEYREQGHEVWLELGLQSSFDDTLQRINRGHNYEEYRKALRAARQRGLPVCTHLIMGLPGEDAKHAQITHQRVITEGVDGLKFHPLHVVKGTQLANSWRRGEYQPMEMHEYVTLAVDLIEATPPEIIFHRLTATASTNILLAPQWCNLKWQVLNDITRELHRRGSYQGSALEKKQQWLH